MAAAWWAISECRMQFPRPCVASRIRIVGIATFVDAVESSLSRIACETAPRMCARRTRGPDSPPPDRWAAYPRAPARTRARSCVPGQRRPCAYREVDVRIKGLPRIFSGSRASSTRGQAPLCPDRRPPRPQHPIVSVFRRGGLHFGRHTNQSHARTSTKQGELRCERCTVELTPRRGRHQTGGIAPIEARHAGDTPAGGF